MKEAMKVDFLLLGLMFYAFSLCSTSCVCVYVYTFLSGWL